MHHHVLSHAESASSCGTARHRARRRRAGAEEIRSGATDTEIKIGNIMPYSGPASSYATIGKTEAAYFKMINAEGGINGRKINFISYDDGYSPPKTVEQARKLVESDEVSADLQSARHAGQHGDPEIHEREKGPADLRLHRRRQVGRPEEVSVDHGLATELPGRGAHLCHVYPEELSRQNDRRPVPERRLREGLPDWPARWIRQGRQDDRRRGVLRDQSPTVDSQVVQIKGANPDIFVNIATPKFAAQAIKKVGEMGWHPVQFLTNVSVSVGGVMKPAGSKTQGILSAAYLKDPNDPQWKNDPAMNEWRAFMTKWYPEGDQDDAATVFGYGVAKGSEQVLQAVRRRYDPREPHEAGGQHEFRNRHLSAGHQDQDQPDRFCPARAVADDAVQGRELGVVRTDDVGREE